MSSENYNILSITILKYLLRLSQHVSRSLKLIHRNNRTRMRALLLLDAADAADMRK